jgi:conjugative transfer pilus assembly protein TraH
MYKQLSILGLLLILPLAASAANFDRLVKDILPQGTMYNATRSAMIKEQQAGHMIGGSLVVKTAADPQLQLVSATAPSMNIGGLPCGAQIELMGGSLSMISGAELANYLKKLPQSSATYGAIMSIKTACPQCENLLEFLDAKADWLNSLAMNKCHAMQALMDPIFPKKAAKSEALRQSKMVLTGGGRDMTDFQSKSKRDDGSDPTRGIPELEGQLGDNFNLVWKALRKKVSEARTDATELKELLMSISGTVVSQKDASGRFKLRHLKSLVNRDLIKQMIGADGIDSDKIKLYKCDEVEACLQPEIKEQQITQGALFFWRVQKIVSSIVEKIFVNNGSLTAEEETIIALSSEQLILKIEMDLATYSEKNNVVSNQTEYIEALSYEVITSYLQSLLVEVQEAISELQDIQMSDKAQFKSFEEDTRQTMILISKAKTEAFGRYDLIAKSRERLKRDMKYFDQSFEAYFSHQKDN